MKIYLYVIHTLKINLLLLVVTHSRSDEFPMLESPIFEHTRSTHDALCLNMTHDDL